MPLRTNEEMVRILQRYNNRNDIINGTTAHHVAARWKYVHKIDRITRRVRVSWRRLTHSGDNANPKIGQHLINMYVLLTLINLSPRELTLESHHPLSG